MSTCPVCEGHGSYAKVDGRPLVFVTCRSCSGSGEIDEEGRP